MMSYDNSRDKSPLRGDGDEKSEQYIRDLVKKRGVLKARLTRFVNYINSNRDTVNLTSQNRNDLKLRIQGATGLYTEFNRIQTNIEEAVNDSNLDEQLTQREMFEDGYYSIQAYAESLLNPVGNDVVATSSTKAKQLLQTVKLPIIPMPTFDGSYEGWLEFRDTFLSLIHRSTELCDVQKFHYLKSALKGSAVLVIDSLELTSSNYSVAWELLLNRFDNHRLLIHNHVKSLFNIAALNKESHISLRKLIDTTLKNLRALNTLGEPTDYWDTLIIYMVVSKLDKTTEREWEQHKGTLTSHDSQFKIKLDHLMTFLKNRSDMLETLQVSRERDHNKQNEVTKTQNINNNKQKSHCNVSSTNKQQKLHYFDKACVLCKLSHPIYSCVKFLGSDLNSKLKVIKDNNLCENCLRAGHNVESCRYGPCKKCSKKHNSLIHSDSPAPSLLANVPSSSITPATMSISGHTNIHASHIQNLNIKPVLLSTALVEVIDNNNVVHIVRALLDNGSQRCFISKSLCNLLCTHLIQSTHEIRGVGNSVTQCTQICEIEIKSHINTYTTNLQCFVLPQITSDMPFVYQTDAKFSIPDGVQLADPQFLDYQNIDILIGADKFWDLLTIGKIRLQNGPYLLNTKLGWIISGPINSHTHNEGHIQCNFTHTTDTLLRQFWELEEVPSARCTQTDEERACEEHFVRTTTRNGDGRFCVRIPFKQSPEVLGDTYPQAERRFFALERRLQRSNEYKKLYSDFIHEYENLGHMTEVQSYNSPHYILPHHGVFREHSTTTKLRVVFDASAASSSNLSLNDLQMVGPPIQGDLFAILLRFRQHRYVACADVEKMYRQCLIAEDQRDLHLILWRDDITEPLRVYRLNTVTYGTASAPFLSVRCVKQLAIECEDPDVKRIINEDMYVDDMITGMDDREKLLNICSQTAQVLKSGCFPLRKWIFNFQCKDNELSFISNESSHTLKELTLSDNSSSSKTLGMGWYSKSDEFHFNSHYDFKNNSESVTKRTILSHISQIFDPLGLLSPTIMLAKVLLQRLWLLKLGWDDELPDDVTRIWNLFVKSLSIIDTIRIPRHVIDSYHSYTHIELHIFTDASQVAYGSCIYVRTVSENSVVSVRLLCSKGKVAPLKPITIPRLELCGALLGAKLYDKVINSLRCQFSSTIFWSDSTIVLGWLRMAPNLLKQFVQNRVSQIHDLTKDIPWRHVSGKHNPADLVSRGASLDELSNSSLWWEGPRFLHDSDFNFDNLAQVPNNNDTHSLPEIKTNVLSFLTQDTSATTDDSIFPFSRFSQFSRMIHTAAYVLRFIHNTRNKNNKRLGGINSDELKESTTLLIKLTQLECFPNEYNILSQNKQLKHKHNLSKYSLFIDEQKILRVGGRIQYSLDFSIDKKHPILLLGKHHFTLLLFRNEHRKLLHAAPQALLYHMRDTWWPLGGRNLARKVVHDCITCKRLRGKTLTPLMGNLPSERVTPTYPFLKCGVDYCGPVYILNRKGRGARLIKAYVCLFICFVTRAIHLELVSDLTTDAYLLALKRFLSRRGKPAEIFSDNGRNFVGLRNDFAHFLTRCSSDIIDYATSQQIKFRFLVPYAAHMAGFWESGVKSCKYHLRRVIGNAHLTFEEFSTVLTQIEAVLNSRPLSPISSDPHDFIPLSPAHFLVGRTLTAPVSDDLSDINTNRLSRYQQMEQIRQHFWARWSKEYISELQTRIKWREHTEDLQPNTLVVIKDDRLPPLKWHLGRIVRTIPGKDGIARVADVQTGSGVVRRSYTKICPLVSDEATMKT